MERENHIRLGVRGSNIGINPFEMEVTELGGRPGAQAGEMVRMLKKTYLASIGPKQEMIVRQLVIDTYRREGILEADPDNWVDPLTGPGLAFQAHASEPPPQQAAEYPLAEDQARETGLGLWVDAHPVLHWDWRKGVR